MIESSEHFLEDKKQHTEIKHKLFHDTFSSILGIAAKFSDTNSFSYLDLYAGQGKFSDNSFGSPMLALKTISESKDINSFHQVKCFFSESDIKSYEKLEKNINSLKFKRGSNSKIITSVKCGSWNENSEQIDEFLKYSKWGFIFIDPFSNEIDLDELFSILKNRTKLIDFMFFINVQSMKRIVGQNTRNEKVARFLGIDKEELIHVMDKDIKISELLQNRFKELNKDYILNASIPTTRNNQLINIDNFQLILGTNSIGVADTFLTSYVESIIEFKENIQLSLFNTLEQSIINIIKEYETISVHELTKKLYKTHNSWKHPELNNMPTTDNTYININSLIKNGFIDFSAPDFLQNKKRNQLKKDAFKKNSKMKEVYLKLKTRKKR